jgi:hypothetical protein
LTRAQGGVRQCQIVLPDHNHLYRSSKFVTEHVRASLLQWFRRDRDVNITLALLDSDEGYDMEEEQERSRESLIREATSACWVVRRTRYDRLGCYQLEQVKNDRCDKRFTASI